MLSAPKQDWSLYESRVHDEHIRWLQGFTPEKALALYEEVFLLASSIQEESDGTRRLEALRWEEKLAIRRKLCKAFA